MSVKSPSLAASGRPVCPDSLFAVMGSVRVAYEDLMHYRDTYHRNDRVTNRCLVDLSLISHRLWALPEVAPFHKFIKLPVGE